MNNEGSFWIDEEEGVLIIKDIDGVEDKFIIEDELFIDENTYLILVPEEMVVDEKAEAFVLKLVSDGDEEYLSVVDDEAEFEMVKAEYMSGK